MDTPQKQEQSTIACRLAFAPSILAALMSTPGNRNDDREVAHAVSLADKLARAIAFQPVDES